MANFDLQIPAERFQQCQDERRSANLGENIPWSCLNLNLSRSRIFLVFQSMETQVGHGDADGGCIKQSSQSDLKNERSFGLSCDRLKLCSSKQAGYLRALRKALR